MDKETEFVPTRGQRRDVCAMVHSEWDQKMIATDLGISLKTLRKHFRVELRDGAKLLEKYAKLAFAERALDKGSIPALKILAGHDQRPKVGVQKAETAPKAPILGKKEQRKVDAARLAGDGVFATPIAKARVNGSHRSN